MKRFFINYVQICADGVFSTSEAVMADTQEEARKKFSETHPGYVFADIRVVPDVSLNEAEEGDEDGHNYRDAIVAMIDKQRAKGLEKYGQTLEDNTTLTNCQRIEHAQEELVDALQYLEHLKQTQADRLTANDFQRAAMRTASGMDHEGYNGRGLLLNAVMGLNGEAGEVIDHVKKVCFQGHELDQEHLVEELGDVAWYLAVCAEALGVTLEEVLQRNIDKLKARYPEGFDKARSINRKEAAENGQTD
jgi:NTP pyrophosphatase (non-canonical NTP hydrolase)